MVTTLTDRVAGTSDHQVTLTGMCHLARIAIIVPATVIPWVKWTARKVERTDISAWCNQSLQVVTRPSTASKIKSELVRS